MDVVKADYHFWKYIYTFVVEQHYQVLSMHDKEVWVTDRERTSKKIIRFVRADLDWANQLKQNIDQTFRRLEPLRKQLRWSHLTLENIYVTAYAPVDDWMHLFEHKQFAIGKVEMSSYLIENDRTNHYEEVRTKLSQYQLASDEEEASLEDYERGVLAYQQAVRATIKHKRDEEVQTFNRGKPLVTYTMIAAIMIMFIWLEYVGSSTSTLTLIEWGAKYNPLIVDGEWWRLVSSMFLHIGFFHLLMNSVALFFLGTLVERIFGSFRFLLIYIIAGLMGSLASFAFMDAVSAGASGAIFGCFGALLYFGAVQRDLFRRTMGTNVILVLVLNLALGFMVQGIDMGAHLGGLAGGFFIAALLGLPKQKWHWFKSVAVLVLVAAPAFLWEYGAMNASNQPEADLQVAAELIQDGQNEEAKPYLVRAVDQDHSLPEIPFLLAYVYLQEERIEEAIPLLEEAIDLNPTFHEALYNLALAQSMLGNEAEALPLVEEAIELQPDEQLYLDLRNQLEGQND